MGRTALVTGAEGFVGRVLCARLADDGWRVLRTDRRAPETPEADYLACDLTDPAPVRTLAEWAADAAVVFHLAAAASVAESFAAAADYLRINTGGVMHLAGAMRAAMPHARLLYVGSAEAYGPPRALPVSEDHPLCPENPYAVSKAAADHYCACLSRAGMLDVVRLRPFNHSGPGQTDRFALPAFARQVAAIEAGKQPPVLRTGNLEARRDFLHVRDVVRAYALAAEKGASGGVYNICSGRAESMGALLEMMRRAARVPFEITPDPARMRPVDIPELRGDNSRLRNDTGWTPRVTPEELVGELLDHWRARAWHAPA